LAALRHEGWEIEEQVSLGARRLPLTVETTLFRVAQEALTNVRKHAATTRVRVALRWQGATVRLEVRDWGRGVRPGAVVAAAAGPGERVGLASMQHRVALVGGRCRVVSRPGGGTRVIVDVPVAPGEGGERHGA